VKDDRAELFVHPESNIFEDFRSAVVIDDEAMVCRMMCETVADRFRNTLVFGFCFPEAGQRLVNRLYVDLVISDINMPGLWGDRIIAHVRGASPTAFTVAMTGCSMDTAYAAGKAQPDFFFDKNKGMDPLWPALEQGFRTARERRDKIFSRYLNESLTAFTKPHWRDRMELKQHLGYSLTEYYRSLKTVKALALLKLNKPLMTQEDLTIISGFSSYQYLKDELAHLSSVVALPER
jgi:CheY-like chemotaxis protein